MPFESDVLIIFWMLIKEVVICESCYVLFYYKINVYQNQKYVVSYNYSMWRGLYTWGLKLYDSIFKLVRDRSMSMDGSL